MITETSSSYRKPRRSMRARGGTVIVAVLLMVILLSFVVVAFMEDATSRIKYYGLFHHRDDLRTDAYSALEASLAVINQYREIDGQLWGPAQGWGNPLQRANFRAPNGSQVRVEVRDESGRLGISSVDEGTLRTLFRVLDFDSLDADRLTDCLLDWMDEDDLRRLNGFDGDDYRNLDPPYSPANRPIRSWDELDLIHGFPEAFYDEDGRPLPSLNQFKDAFSFHHDGPVNMNTMPPIVRRVFEEQGVLDPYAYESYIRRGSLFDEPGEPRVIRNASEAGFTGEGGSVAVESSLMWVQVRASRGEATFLINALVSWTGANPGGGAREEATTAPESEDGERATRTRPPQGSSGELGYPFRIHSIVENRRI